MSSGDSPLLLGLTGLYCAGKNRVAGLLEKRGIPVLDVDKLGHAALESEKAAVAARFGKGVIAPDGSVDRRALGEKVFGQSGELAALEAIVHPAANALTDAWLAEKRSPAPAFLAVNAALLHRSSAFGRLKAIIIVKAPLLARLCRARKRDKLPLGKLLARFRQQSEFSSQYLKTNSDIYIVNNSGSSGTQERLEKRLDEILNSIKV